jgi:hypothetical protein
MQHPSGQRDGAFLIRIVLVIAIGSALVAQVTFDLTQNITLAVVMAMCAIATIPTGILVRTLTNASARASLLAQARGDVQDALRTSREVVATIGSLSQRSIAHGRLGLRRGMSGVTWSLATLLVKWWPALAIAVSEYVTMCGLASHKRSMGQRETMQS